jgi:hypothetical protein
MDDISSASEVAKQVTVVDAIQWLTSSWDSLDSDTITKCLTKCGFYPENLGKHRSMKN